MSKIIAISDIHGCYYTLKKLIDKVNINKEKDKIIFLGDYIDRGKNSFEVVEYIIKLQKDMGKEKCICLMGNHEYMFLTDLELWMYNGGRETKISYYKNNHINYLYNSHKSWFKQLLFFYEENNFIFVHAGLPKSDILSNTKEDMIWDRSHISKEIKRDKIVIFGHTPNKNPYITINNDIGIDTGCVYGNKLTAMIIEDNKKYFISENKDIKD